MAVDLNADVGEIFKELFKKKKKKGGAGASSAKPDSGKNEGRSYHSVYMGTVGVAVGVILLLAAYMFSYYMPKRTVLAEGTDTLAKTLDMQNQLGTLDAQIRNLKKKMSNSRDNYETVLSYFGDRDNLEDLYHSVSTLALMYDLTLRNVKGIELEDKEGSSALVEEIRVDLELEGRYANYMKFKKDLSEEKTLLTINTETIKVKDNKAESGKIIVKTQLTTYTIEKQPFQEAMVNSERILAHNEAR